MKQDLFGGLGDLFSLGECLDVDWGKLLLYPRLHEGVLQR